MIEFLQNAVVGFVGIFLILIVSLLLCIIISEISFWFSQHKKTREFIRGGLIALLMATAVLGVFYFFGTILNALFGW
jgi:uncharacterized membrane protein